MSTNNRKPHDAVGNASRGQGLTPPTIHEGSLSVNILGLFEDLPPSGGVFASACDRWGCFDRVDALQDAIAGLSARLGRADFAAWNRVGPCNELQTGPLPDWVGGLVPTWFELGPDGSLTPVLTPATVKPRRIHTPATVRVLRAVERLIAESDSPAVRAVATEAGVSLRTAEREVARLLASGVITRITRPGRPSLLRVVGPVEGVSR